MAVAEGRKRADWARFVAALARGALRRGGKLVLVIDQLDTPAPASLYSLPARAGQAPGRRLEVHRTPKHGSSLTMAEIEFSALAA